MQELIDTYYDYQVWANQRVLEAARTLPFEALTVVQIETVPPVRETFLHIMWAEQLWISRFQGSQVSGVWNPDEFPDLDSIEHRWGEIGANTAAFRATLSDERLLAPISYAGLQGGVSTYPLWQAMLHQANHGTYHRGEIAAVLTHLGASPGEMDFFRMFDGRR